MADQRRIVPDTSALAPAFFPDRDATITRRARSLLASIQIGGVLAFAPDALQAEFLKRAMREIGSPGAAHDWRSDAFMHVEALWLTFARLNIVYTPAFGNLAPIAWDMASRHHVPAPDAWFAACAVHHDAELWFSHPHGDGAGEHAAAYGVDVRY